MPSKLAFLGMDIDLAINNQYFTFNYNAEKASMQMN